jgi:hypothetical protein
MNLREFKDTCRHRAKQGSYCVPFVVLRGGQLKPEGQIKRHREVCRLL